MSKKLENPDSLLAMIHDLNSETMTICRQPKMVEFRRLISKYAEIIKSKISRPSNHEE